MTDGHLVTVVRADLTRRYSLDDLEPHMLDAPTPPPRARRGISLDTPSTGDRPGDQFNAANTADDVLTDAGWQLHHTDARSGERHYTRPGKSIKDGPSATVYPDGHVCVWTDATDLEPRRWYDPFGLYAALHHNGSIVEATASVRQLGYGPPLATGGVVRRDTAPWAGPHGITIGPHEHVLPVERTYGDEGSGLEPFYVNWPDLWTRDTTGEDWLVQPFIARGRGHAVFAAAGVGKSWFTLEVAAALATGRPILNRPARPPVHVLYLDYEMTADDLRDRLEEFGYDADTDLSHLHYALLPTIPPLDTIDGGYIVHQAAVACAAELVVIDTTARAVGGEENDANVYRAFYAHTGKPLKQAEIAWVRLDHAGKDVLKGQRGSSAKNDDVDVVWRLERREGNGLKLVATKRRMSWVPAEVEFASKQTDVGTVHVAEEPTYPDHTFAVVRLLDELGVPATANRRTVRRHLAEHGITASNQAVGEAMRYRRARAADNTVQPPDSGPDQPRTTPGPQHQRTTKSAADQTAANGSGSRSEALRTDADQPATVPVPDCGTRKGAAGGPPGRVEPQLPPALNPDGEATYLDEEF